MSNRRISTLQNAAQATFAFLKSTTDLQTLWARSITLADGKGHLLPVCELHTTDKALIQTLADWREAASYAYPTQFPVTYEGTANWLRSRLLDDPNRMLWLICDPTGKPVGHVGFASASDDQGFLELDNLVRGSLFGDPDITTNAVETLLNWAQNTIGSNGFFLRVLASLPRVIDFDSKIGFVEVDRTPLRKSISGTTTSFNPVVEGDRAPADDWFVRMEYRPGTECQGESMILTAGPSISEREASYALDAAKNGWNHQWSGYLKKFERSFADYVGRKHAIATSSCTGALHLSLLALGVGPGDEVLVPEITWVATANAVRYTGATPVFVDVEPDTWCLDPKQLESSLTHRTKAIIPVHLYGHPARMSAITAFAKEHGLFIVEDAAPSIGAEADGQKTGTFGEFGCFSFQGAKLLVTGEGGMIVTDDDDLYERVLSLWDQGRDPNRTFWISDEGWKYKMSNVQAAIGLGQIERCDELVEMKRRIFDWYAEGLEGVEGITLAREADYARSIYWMTSIQVGDGIDRETFRAELKARNVDTRPVFPAISQYPIWGEIRNPKPVAKHVGDTAINLPSGVCLRRDQIDYVCRQIKALASSSLREKSVA